jgi:hypothetical protein
MGRRDCRCLAQTVAARTACYLEATGRLGADDGFDVRGYEAEVQSDDGEDDGRDGTDDTQTATGRVWLIQCKLVTDFCSDNGKRGTSIHKGAFYCHKKRRIVVAHDPGRVRRPIRSQR